MNQPLDEAYFDWLIRQVGSEYRSYTSLLERLFLKEFLWHIPNDDNRAVDGRDLRLRFLEQRGITDPPQDWMWLGCSMLEMLIALSERLAHMGDGKPRDWFWQLIRNLELDQYRGSQVPIDAINHTLDRVISRHYRPDGHGGLFPLQYPAQDQREVEIWYQMGAYLLEQAA